MRRFVSLMGVAGLLAATTVAHAWDLNYQPKFTNFEEEVDAKPWEEVVPKLPPPPKAENLREFYVSATAQHKFMIDLNSISVGEDGVVRYTLVTQTRTGVRNTGFEGMRCASREWRGYAFANPDGSWMKSRNSRWFMVEESNLNRYHAALYLEYFCNDRLVQTLPDIRKRLESAMDLHYIRRD